jgi:hypothetical protein
MAIGGQVLNGQRLTAQFFRSIGAQGSFKGASTSATSSTTLMNDAILWVPVTANAIYRLECVISYQGGAQGSSDLNFDWGAPIGTTMAYGVEGITTAGNPTPGFLRGGAGMAVGTNGAGNNFAVGMMGTVNIGPENGALTFRWAQNTSNATPTIVNAGSVLALFQIQ